MARLIGKSSLLIGVSFVVFVPSHSLSAGKDYIKNKQMCSLACEQVVASSHSSGAQTADRVTQSSADLRKKYIKMADDFVQHRDRIDWGGMLLKSNTFMVKEIVGGVPVIGSMMEKGLDHIDKVYDQNQVTMRRSVARQHLKDLEKALNDPNLGKFKTLSVQERAALVSTVADAVLGNRFNDIDDPEIRDDLQNMVIKALAEEIEVIAGLAEQHEEAIALLMQDSREIQKHRRQIKTLRQDLEKVATSQKERVATLSAEAGGKRQDAEAAMEQVKQMSAMTIAQMSRDCGEQFSAASNILNRIGLPEAGKAAAFMAGAANLVAGVAASYVNPMAILPTISGALSLFGGSSDSGDETREMQRQILEALAELSKQIDKNHGEVMTKLRRIEGNQLISMAQLSEIIVGEAPLCADLIPKDKLDDRNLPDLRKDLWFTTMEEFREHVQRYAADSIEPCLSSLNLAFARPSPDFPSQLFQLIPTSGGDLSSAQVDALNKAASLHRDMIAVVKAAFLPQSLPAFAVPAMGSAEINGKVVRLIQRTEQADRLNASNRLNRILENIANPPPAADPRELLSLPITISFRTFFELPLNSRAIYVAGTRLLGAYPYFEMRDFLNAEPDDDTPRSHVGLERLDIALEHTDVAIAQQTVLGGDMLLEVMRAFLVGETDLLRVKYLPYVSGSANGKLVVEKSYAARTPIAWLINQEWLKEDQASVRKMFEDLIGRNPLLAANYAMHYVSEGLRRGGHTVFSYDRALSYGTDPGLLHKVIGTTHQLIRSDKEDPEKGIPKGWYMKVGETPIALPTTKDMMAGTFFVTPELAELMLLKDRLLNAKASFRFAGIPPTPDSETLRELLLVGLRPM